MFFKTLQKTKQTCRQKTTTTNAAAAKQCRTMTDSEPIIQKQIT